MAPAASISSRNIFCGVMKDVGPSLHAVFKTVTLTFFFSAHDLVSQRADNPESTKSSLSRRGSGLKLAHVFNLTLYTANFESHPAPLARTPPLHGYRCNWTSVREQEQGALKAVTLPHQDGNFCIEGNICSFGYETVSLDCIWPSLKFPSFFQITTFRSSALLELRTCRNYRFPAT